MTNDKYSIYEKNVSKLIPWIMEQIEKSPEGINSTIIKTGYISENLI